MNIVAECLALNNPKQLLVTSNDKYILVHHSIYLISVIDIRNKMNWDSISPASLHIIANIET